MKRTIDAYFINGVANSDDVRPLLGGSGEIDLAPILANPENFALVSDKGGFVGINQGAGVYEAHTIFHPGDGKGALIHARDCISWMFLNTDCVELRTKVPVSNQPAKWLAVTVGMKEKFVMRQPWSDHEEDISFLSLSVDDWIVKDKPAIAEGKSFHDAMGEIKHDDHGDDDVHYAYVGGCLLMAKAANGIKGATIYNKWASFAGYQPIKITALTPPTFQMADSIVQVVGGNVEIMTCR